MSRSMRHLALLAIGLLLLVNFTNCDSSSHNPIFQPGSDFLNSESECDPFVEVCSGNQTGAEYIELLIRNFDPIYVSQGFSTFDVAGDCYAGDFPSNRIVWDFYSPSGAVLSSNDNGVCNAGRFSLSIPIPEGFDWGQEHQLSLELRVYDETGQEYTNSFLARQTIGVRPD